MSHSADFSAQPRRQVGALPFRREPEREVEVYLITSRESRRWVIPKGWPMKGRKPFEAAEQEAYEEAGLVGQIGRRPLGFYFYQKRLRSRDLVLCSVKVFPLEVRKQLPHWPEQDQRDGAWFPSSHAADIVAEAGLAAMIRAFANRGAELLT